MSRKLCSHTLTLVMKLQRDCHTMSHIGKLEATEYPVPGSQPLHPQELLNQRLHPKLSLLNPFQPSTDRPHMQQDVSREGQSLAWAVLPLRLRLHWLCVHRAFFPRNADTTWFPSCFRCSEQTSSPLSGNRNYTVSLCPVVLSAGFQHSPVPTKTSTRIPCREVVQ